MSYMPVGQFISGQSVLHRTDARAKIIGLFVMLAAIIATSTVWGYAFILCVTVAIVLLSGLPVKTAFGSIFRLWLFFIVIFLMNALFFDDARPIWSWWIFSLSIGGMIQGAHVAIRLALIVVLSNVLTCTTAPMDVTTALSSLMKPLKFICVPVDDVAMIISVAIQFIPTLIEETDMIKKAQIARGARFESKRVLERAASFAPLVVPIFLSSFRRADELSVAMEARGYRNARHRTKKEKRPLSWADFAAMAVCIAVCAVQIYVF